MAPHPDDETIGAGGLMLRRKKEGGTVGWLIMTGLLVTEGWLPQIIANRSAEIQQVSKLYNFDDVFQLDFPTTQLDSLPLGDVVTAIANVFKVFNPQEIVIPHYSDIHSDHRIVFDAVSSCTKWFRYPSIKRVLVYETLSETDFSLKREQVFYPNFYVDISEYLDKKLQIMDVYASEMDYFPFPRSREAIAALAQFRGASSGYKAAEAFQLVRERF